MIGFIIGMSVSSIVTLFCLAIAVVSSDGK